MPFPGSVGVSVRPPPACAGRRRRSAGQPGAGRDAPGRTGGRSGPAANAARRRGAPPGSPRPAPRQYRGRRAWRSPGALGRSWSSWRTARWVSEGPCSSGASPTSQPSGAWVQRPRRPPTGASGERPAVGFRSAPPGLRAPAPRRVGGSASGAARQSWSPPLAVSPGAPAPRHGQWLPEADLGAARDRACRRRQALARRPGRSAGGQQRRRHWLANPGQCRKGQPARCARQGPCLEKTSACWRCEAGSGRRCAVQRHPASGQWPPRPEARVA